MRFYLPPSCVLVLAFCLASTWSLKASPAAALQALEVSPKVVEQKDKPSTTIEATVTLENPSTTFFICAIRSADEQKLRFSSVVFRTGDSAGKAKGVVQWRAVLKPTRVQVKAYSLDEPYHQLSFTVLLKPRAVDDGVPLPKPTDDSEN